MPFAEQPLVESDPLTGRFRSFARVQTPRAGRTLARWTAGLGLLILLAGFLPWTQNIRSTGALTTLRPQTVPSTIAGRIQRWRVREGQHVRKGDTLVDIVEIKEKYFDPQLVQRTKEQLNAKISSLGENRAKGTALNSQQAALRTGLQVSLSKARNYVKQSQLKVNSDAAELVATRNDFTIAERQQQRQEELYKQGLKSLTELEQRRLKFQESRAKLQASENKLAARPLPTPSWSCPPWPPNTRTS